MSKERILGALFSKPDVRDYVATTKMEEFPDAFELKLPKVKNQGTVGSCVAHALSTVVEYFNKLAKTTAIVLQLQHMEYFSTNKPKKGLWV